MLNKQDKNETNIIIKWTRYTILYSFSRAQPPKNQQNKFKWQTIKTTKKTNPKQDNNYSLQWNTATVI
jgi:hypothetical protein